MSVTITTPRSESLPQINFPSEEKAWNLFSLNNSAAIMIETLLCVRTGAKY